MTDPVSPPKESLPSRHSGTQLITLFLSVASAAAIVLALLGYGVAVSVESVFAIPHSMLFSSTTDLLALGGWAVIQTFTHLNRLGEWGFYVELLKRTWPGVLAGLIVCVIGCVAVSLNPFARDLGKYIGLRPIHRLSRLREVAKRHTGAAKTLVAMLGALAYALLAPPIGMLLVLAALVLAGVGIAVVPLAGVNAGTDHIIESVVKPLNCEPLVARDKRMQPRTTTEASRPTNNADCVTVKKSGSPEYRGRVVFATSNAVVLYDPSTGGVRRVSTEGASIEVIDKL